MTQNQVIDGSIIIIAIYWILSSSYVVNWHITRMDLTFGTFILALFLGPILAIIVRDFKKETNEERHDRQRRWFHMNTPLDRNNIPEYGRSIPPPPPRSRINAEDVRTEWRGRNGISGIKDFKFLRNNVENR